MNFQIQLTKDQQALPLTRDYMRDVEDGMRTGDTTATRSV